MNNPLQVAFVWHMHQPYYRDISTGEVTLPWVRLHGIKDYLDMVAILEEFPAIHQTFNLVPSLIDQIEDYIEGKVNDKFLDLSRKGAEDLTDEEKCFALSNFFMANWENMVKIYPRYYDLLLKRGKFAWPNQIDKLKERFSIQDFLDLQVWFNLAWFDSVFKETDPVLRNLIRKGSNFSEEDKSTVLNKQIEILRQIVPKYRRLQESGQVEITTSPYYHPILPLLCDTDIAREPNCDTLLPSKRFRHPEDAKWHIDRAVEHYKGHFGVTPRGMWPSEGSVSEEILPLIMDVGINWIATDEDILFKSLQSSRSGRLLYRPYLLDREGKSLNIVFRDRILSDLIGFTYYNWPVGRAVTDLIGRFHHIRDELSRDVEEYLVTILLDGENAWEFYPRDGREFLIRLYKVLSQDPTLKTVTVSEFLEAHPPKDSIEKLAAGSWIRGDFANWIGQQEKNLAWDYLSEARETLSNYQDRHPQLKDEKELSDAWIEAYIVEGSDWNWWYGVDHSSDSDEEFDRLYRRHLSNIYTLIGQKIPDYLRVPIRTEEVRPTREPAGLIEPVIDGLDTDYYEWLEAGFLNVTKLGGTMHRSEGITRSIYYGFDLKKLYLRIDMDIPQEKTGLKVVVETLASKQMRLEIPIYGKIEALLFEKDHKWNKIKDIKDVALNKILEIGIDFNDLKVGMGEEIKVSVAIQKEDLILEKLPLRGPIRIKLPTPDYQSRIWSV